MLMSKVYGMGEVDWSSMESVIAFAKKMGPGMVVIRHPNRDNYNIVHASRTDRYQPDWVVFST